MLLAVHEEHKRLEIRHRRYLHATRMLEAPLT